MKDLEILTSADGSCWTSRGAFQFAPADGTETYCGQLFEDLGWDGVRYVWFEDATAWCPRRPVQRPYGRNTPRSPTDRPGSPATGTAARSARGSACRYPSALGSP